MAGNTVNFANLSQRSVCTFNNGSGTTAPLGSDGNPVPDSGYQAVAAILDPTVVSVHQQVPGVNSFQIIPLKAGASTTITWTLNPITPYSGAPYVLPADTINIAALSIESAQDSYAPPA